ncbi:hypothetical protein HGA64_02280 [Candidatus Falkowbacteria bacterium]|nr:hypothetical protein [Candidatus Falkowbacteria bacterium]
MLKVDEGFSAFGDVLKNRVPAKKAPAYEWQDLALRVIKEMSVPNMKRNSVFKICKLHSKQEVEQAMNDTKELCQTGEKWRYFFKIVDKKPDSPKKEKQPE